VLVAVTEDVQDAQRVVLWRGGHPEAWLKVPDHFLSRWLNALEVLLPIPFPLLLREQLGNWVLLHGACESAVRIRLQTRLSSADRLLNC